MQKTTLLYLHGFNSDGGGFKYDRLRKKFKSSKVLSPDLPAEPNAVIALVDPLIKQQEGITYCIGTSLGGFYTYYFAAKYQTPCFLFNPSLKPHRTLDRGIGIWETFHKKRPYVFKKEYLEQLRLLKEEADQKVQSKHLNFFLAEDDDILDLSGIPNLYPDANTIEWYADTGHSFIRFPDTFSRMKVVMQQHQESLF